MARVNGKLREWQVKFGGSTKVEGHNQEEAIDNFYEWFHSPSNKNYSPKIMELKVVKELRE
jgi:hypothetical protein